MGMPIDPAATGGYPTGVITGPNGGNAGATGPQPITAANATVLENFDRTRDDAKRRLDAAGTEVTSAAQALAEAQATPFSQDPTGDKLTSASQRYARADSAYASALATWQKASADANQAHQDAVKSSDPTTRQYNQATADRAATEAKSADAQFQEWQDAAPGRKAQVAAQQRLTNLQSDSQYLKNQVDAATAPSTIEAARQAVAANGVAIQQAQQSLDTAKQLGPIQVQQAQAGARQATTAAGVAEQTAPAAVTTANEGAKQASIGTQAAQANLDNILRQIRQAPTDEQARAALEQALQQGQANLEQTRGATAAQAASTARLNALMPGEVAQQGATLAQTQAQTAQLQQGTLAGLDQYIAQQKDAIAKGLISPQQADQALTARIAGTDVFSAAKAANDAMVNQTNQQLSQRSQEAQLAGQRAGTFGGMANSALGTFAQLNNTAPIGSDVVGKGLLAYLDLAQGKLNQFQAPPREPSTPLPPFLQQFAGNPQSQGQPQTPMGAPPVAPTSPSAPQTSAPVTINIGGGAQPTVSTGTQGAGNPWAGGNTPRPGTTWQNPAFAAASNAPLAPIQPTPTGVPAVLQGYQPATTDTVRNFFAQRYGSPGVF